MTIQNIMLIFLLFGIVGMFFFGIYIPKQERHECLIWQDQAAQFTDWSATPWQVDQCDHYGIILPR